MSVTCGDESFESEIRTPNGQFGDGDVVDFMMVTDLRRWWQNHYVGEFFVMLVIFPMY